MAPKRAVPDDGSGDTDVKRAKSEGGSVKRGRGRPPLPEHLRKTPAEYVPKGRGRGRPKKVKKAAPQRGRPKKTAESSEESKGEEEDDEEEEEAAAEEEEVKKPKKPAAKQADSAPKGKGRGRPKKTQKRGRPKKQTADEEDES